MAAAGTPRAVSVSRLHRLTSLGGGGMPESVFPEQTHTGKFQEREIEATGGRLTPG